MGNTRSLDCSSHVDNIPLFCTNHLQELQTAHSIQAHFLGLGFRTSLKVESLIAG